MALSIKKIKDLIASIKSLKKHYPQELGSSLEDEIEQLEDALEKTYAEQYARGWWLWHWHFQRLEKRLRDLQDKNKNNPGLFDIIEKILSQALDLMHEAQAAARAQEQADDLKKRLEKLSSPTAEKMGSNAGLFKKSLGDWRKKNGPTESDGGSSQGGIKNRPRPH